mgnify:CR=1 FL=1
MKYVKKIALRDMTTGVVGTAYLGTDSRTYVGETITDTDGKATKADYN